MQKKSHQQPRKSAQQQQTVAPAKRRWRLLPVLPVFFILTWIWAGWYYGSVFHVSREYSFWVADTRIMEFILSQPYGILRYMGRAMLQLYKYPWLGGLLMALMLTAISWLAGYCMRQTLSNSLLKGENKKSPFKGDLEGLSFLQYLPALCYMAAVTFLGLDVFFEARTGFIFGIPFVMLVVLCIWGVIIRSFRGRPTPSPSLVGRGVYRLVISIVSRTISSPPYKGGVGGGSVFPCHTIVTTVLVLTLFQQKNHHSITLSITVTNA